MCLLSSKIPSFTHEPYVTQSSQTLAQEAWWASSMATVQNSAYGTHYVQERSQGRWPMEGFPKGRDINTADRYCKQALKRASSKPGEVPIRAESMMGQEQHLP